MLTYAGVYCEGQCNCHACHNNPRFEMDRQAAIGVTLGMCVCVVGMCVCVARYTLAERNPIAFRPKVQSILLLMLMLHTLLQRGIRSPSAPKCNPLQQRHRL